MEDHLSANEQIPSQILLITQLTGREEGYSDGQNLVIGCKPVTMLSSSHSPDRGNV